MQHQFVTSSCGASQLLTLGFWHYHQEEILLQRRVTHPSRRGQPFFGTHHNRSGILFISTVWYFFTRASCQATCLARLNNFASPYFTYFSHDSYTLWSNPFYKLVSFLQSFQLTFICILITLVLCMVTCGPRFCVVFSLTSLLTYKKSRVLKKLICLY